MTVRFGSVAALTELTDDELADFAQRGDSLAQETLIERYRRFARAKARGYFLVGGDADDIEQEALIGLYKAVRDYQADRLASFRGFAELCITRQIITAIKTATRFKHRPLNQYVSISGSPTGDDEQHERGVEDLLNDHHAADPVEQVISSERMGAMRDAMTAVLSGLEVDVLNLYVAGRSYQEIGDQLGRHVKSIDNALQRIKRKLDTHLTSEAQADLDLDLRDQVIVLP
ncbi:MAG: RNA polymerase sporulation sigma factor SigH [Actinobacteria bacterium]|nr:RNA polymerase sporulation sigma factor SigH [Actinomycetota bacterium]MBI3257186.1 RNA polymerase sporulation sigma factor SigH [Actinomycetota bacterium]